MILIDPRAGSGDLLPLLPRHLARHSRLAYGDASLIGIGPDGPVLVGAEVKQLSDILACIEDGRFAGGQLPGLIATYDFYWLVVEGNYKAARDGVLLRPHKGRWVPAGHGQRRWMWQDIESWLLTQQLKAGVRVKHTFGREDTARFLLALHSWWSAKWTEHTSHLSFYTLPPDRALLRRPSLTRIMLAQVPTLGWARSAAAEKHFGGSLLKALNAGPEEWATVSGRSDSGRPWTLGRSIAAKVAKEVAQLKGAPNGRQSC